MAIHLVTGAAGFIGSIVCKKLVEAGHTVVGVDNLNDYYDIRLKDYRLSLLLGDNLSLQSDSPVQSIYAKSEEQTSGAFTFLFLDIENFAALDALFKNFRFNTVFNLAARAGVRYSMQNPHVYLTTNTHGTLNLLECQRKYGVHKQVLASTSSLYAGCAMPFVEDLPVNTPLSPYAASKKAAEMFAYSYHKLYNIDITVVRYFTVFGPAGRPDMSIFRFIKWIDEGIPIELFGDGTQSRDFTYVDDVANGTVAAAAKVGYEVVNIGGGRNPISLNTVIAIIEKALGKKARLNNKPFHIADIMETWADITKAKRLFGWEPAIAPEDGFKRCVEWYLANREWLAKVQL